jgi:hypothetical protein
MRMYAYFYVCINVMKSVFLTENAVFLKQKVHNVPTICKISLNYIILLLYFILLLWYYMFTYCRRKLVDANSGNLFHNWFLYCMIIFTIFWNCNYDKKCDYIKYILHHFMILIILISSLQFWIEFIIYKLVELVILDVTIYIWPIIYIIA